MSLKYDVYDAAYKIFCVEDFLRLKESDSNSIGYGSYASSKGIKKSTFISWVQKYNTDKEKHFKYSSFTKEEIEKRGNDDVILTSSYSEAAPQFIPISKDTVSYNNEVTSANKEVRINIDNLTINFDVAILSEVLEALRKC